MDNYNYNENDNNLSKDPSTNFIPPKKTPLATASLIFAILSIFGSLTIWFGIMFSFAAIVLAILARVNYNSFNFKSLTGLIIGIMFFIFSMLMFFTMLSMLKNPEYVNMINEMLNQYYEQYEQSSMPVNPGTISIFIF